MRLADRATKTDTKAAMIQKNSLIILDNKSCQVVKTSSFEIKKAR